MGSYIDEYIILILNATEDHISRSRVDVSFKCKVSEERIIEGNLLSVFSVHETYLL